MNRVAFILSLNGLNYIIKIKIMKKLPIISFFVKWYENYKMKKKIQKKLEELKKRDPFIYKNF